MQTEVTLTPCPFSFHPAGGFSHLGIPVHGAYVNTIVGLVDNLQGF